MATSTHDGSAVPMRVLMGVSAAVALGSLLLTVAHAGVRIPLLDALGPSGAAVPPAAIGFGLATVLHVVVLVGILRARPWSWAAALVVHGLTLAAAAMPFRGIGSALGIVLTAIALALLASRPVRHRLLPRRGDAPR